LNISEQIQREGGQSVSRLGELDHSLLVKIPFLAAFPPLWSFPSGVKRYPECVRFLSPLRFQSALVR